MALCCIGGVCVPYTALIPVIVLGLQWIVQKLVAAGLLPQAWCNALQKYTSTSANASKQTIRRGKQCKSATCCAPVVECKTENDWKSLWCSTAASVVLIKFTAEWCKPCKAIQPHFEKLNNDSSNRIQLATVDSDELEDVAAEYRVMQLPTFVAVDVATRKAVGSSYAGSDPSKLQEWWGTTQKKFE